MNDELIKYLLGRILELEKQVKHSECPCVVEEREEEELQVKQENCDHVYPENLSLATGSTSIIYQSICVKCGKYKPLQFDINDHKIANVNCEHEYPSPWFATIPPNCIKCGQKGPHYVVTCETTTRIPPGNEYC
jgi:hypothetical protein